MARIETVEITVEGRKKIVNADDPRATGGAQSGIPTREEISKMGKGEVVDWLDAHGVEGAKGKVADLRNQLARILYVDFD
jgi:hypothetical protein